MEDLRKKCECLNTKGIYTIVFQPGTCGEAVVKCEDCGKLWYTLLFEQMRFDGMSDDLEDYQIPITNDEFESIKEIEYRDLSLDFLLI